MQERFNAKISADISSFLRKMSQVDKKIKETAFECTKPIDADIKRAMTKMERVDQKAKELAKESKKDVDANVTKAIAKLNQVNEKAREVSREETKPIDADITRAKRKLDEIKIIATQWSKDHIKKPVTLDISEYRKKMAELKASESGLRKKIEVSVHADTKGFTAKLNALLAKKRDYHINVKARTALFRKEIANLKARQIGKEIFLQIRARNERFYRDLDNIAESIRSWGVVLGNILKGTFIAVIPSIAAFGAAATGALATVGAMTGVLTGGLLGLTSAFGVAAAAIGAFAVTAVGHMKKFKDFMKGEGPGTKEMEALRDSVNGLKEDHKKLSDQLESNNFETFNNGVQAARKVLNKLNGLMVDSSGVMKNLSKSLNESMDSAPMERFFNYLNSNGASTLDKVARGVGFFGRSLASLMVAFGPLAASMSQGFLDMSKRVDEWSAKLADSKGMQQFTNYVNENIPKIRGAFRDLTVGLVQMFAAFGPMAATAMSWFERLMGRFREWSSQLSQNQAFKNFVKYIEEAAPKVGQLIGNLAKTFSLLAQGMAPLAMSILNVANAFLQWFNALMQTNPGVAQLIAKMITLAGVALAVVPALTLIHSWLKPIEEGGLGVKAALTAVSEVFGRVGVSMMGVVATIAVVVAAFVHLYNTNQTTHDLMNSIWTNIKQLFVTFAQIAMQAIDMVVSVLGSLVSAAAPVINVVLSIVNAFLSWLNQTLQNNQWLRTLIATVLAAAGAFRLIVTVVTTVKAAMTVLSAAVNASKVALAAWGAVSSVVSAAGTVITTVLAAVRVAFMSLLGPWGIVAAVIIGGLVTLYNKCEWFRNAVDAVFKAIGDVFKWIGDKIGKALEYVGLKSKESSQQVSESMDQMKQKAQESGEGTAAAAEGAASRIAQSSASTSASLDGMSASFANLDASAIAHFTSISNSMMSLTGIGAMGALTNITGMVMNSDMQFMQMSNSANLNMAAVNTAATTNTAMAAENVNANLSAMTLNSNAQLDALSANATAQFGMMNSVAGMQTGLMPGVVGANLSQVDMAAQTSLNNVSMTNQATWENVANTANTATANLATGVVSNFQNMQSQVQSAMQGVTSAVEQGCSQVQSSTSSTFSSVASNISSTMASISSNISSSFSTISSTVQQAASQMEQTLQNAFNSINNATSNSMSQLESRIRQAQSTVVSTVQQMGSQAVSTLQSYYGQFVSAGGYLMDGFIAGMQSRAGAVMATAMSIANAAASAIRSALAIHSPSRVVAKITRWVPMGMVVGMKDTANKAINYAGKLATQVADNINYAVSPANLNSDINNIGVTRNDIISGEVRTEYDFSKRPMQLNLQLGNNAFGKFVDDVNNVNKQNIQLEEVYSI
nr:MAG TPA: tail tape measure [Bacteriophage sp.]